MKWKTLVHNGIAFPAEYQAQGFSIKIKGKKVALTPDQEEMAMAWAKKKDTPYVQDPVFAANFMNDFLKLFPKEYQGAKISDVDFSELNNFVDREKQKKETMTKEEKKQLAAERKKIKEELKAKFGWAEVDGSRFDVANWMVEPPGIFMGRGQHPFRGKWKPRTYPKDVTLNLGKEAPKPEGAWGKIVHDHDSTWLARWMDKLTEKEKYVWLSDSSTLRQQQDMAKYDKATNLAKNFDKVTKSIREGMSARDKKKKTVATTCFLIWKLAMRVGDEKDPDEADTVGASTLRVEHIKVKGEVVEFDFLGKDSVRWEKSLECKGDDKIALENIQSFTKGKKPTDLLFSEVTSRTVNEFLSSALKGLTAKVFRTYLATELVKKYLCTVDNIKETSEHNKLYQAKMANLQAAIMCNHKRAIPKNYELSLEKKKQSVEKAKESQPKTDKQAEKKKERIEKLTMQLELAISTKDYNLNTSLRNYIDPRVCTSWCKHVDLDWKKLYSTTLQRKFMWAANGVIKWDKIKTG